MCEDEIRYCKLLETIKHDPSIQDQADTRELTAYVLSIIGQQLFYISLFLYEFEIYELLHPDECRKSKQSVIGGVFKNLETETSRSLISVTPEQTGYCWSATHNKSKHNQYTQILHSHQTRGLSPEAASPVRTVKK